MLVQLGNLTFDLKRPFDISTALDPSGEGPNCFHAPRFHTDPVRAEGFVGSTAEGGPLNFLNLHLNPHGNGTHTECVGHIAQPRKNGPAYTINRILHRFHWTAELISVTPTILDDALPGMPWTRAGDQVILAGELEQAIKWGESDALVLRTLPNSSSKRTRNWSGTNPPYLEPAALTLLADRGVQHLLLDLPSVDREEDEGALAAHRAFWRYPENPREDATITEMVFVPTEIPDGQYLLLFQIAALEIDVSPSKPILYPVLK
jgi:kynurenine formamidase